MAKNNKSCSRSKHIDIKYLAIREHVKDKKLVIEHVRTEVMLAYLLTKVMPPKKFKDHVVTMGLSATMWNFVVTMNVYKTLFYIFSLTVCTFRFIFINVTNIWTLNKYYSFNYMG